MARDASSMPDLEIDAASEAPTRVSANTAPMTTGPRPEVLGVMSGAEDMDNWPDVWKELDTTAYQDVIE